MPNDRHRTVRLAGAANARLDGGMRRAAGVRAVVLVLSAAVVCSACAPKTAHTLSADAYYRAMAVGDFAAMSHDQLDKVGQALCSDLENMEASKRPSTVIVLKQSTDTEQEAFEVGKAMTGRWCPEYVGVFDY